MRYNYEMPIFEVQQDFFFLEYTVEQKFVLQDEL
jgi:hypothetical protein